MHRCICIHGYIHIHAYVHSNICTYIYTYICRHMQSSKLLPMNVCVTLLVIANTICKGITLK